MQPAVVGLTSVIKRQEVQ